MSTTMYKAFLLETILDMLDRNREVMFLAGANSDYIDGANSGLKELAVKLDLCEYSDLKD